VDMCAALRAAFRPWIGHGQPVENAGAFPTACPHRYPPAPRSAHIPTGTHNKSDFLILRIC
ncbi:hypothetical protein, partial [Acetobacter sp. AAB5]|uniref:hypothetical protein n=1 Tax=Acetobacter sp. AAB5 TaxID=3418370 RepID=UPI003CF21F14